MAVSSGVEGEGAAVMFRLFRRAAQKHKPQDRFKTDQGLYAISGRKKKRSARGEALSNVLKSPVRSGFREAGGDGRFRLVRRRFELFRA